MIWKSKFPDVVIANVPFADYLFENMAVHDPDRIGMIDAITGRTLTFREIIREIKLLASALSRRGIKKGDAVGVCSLNCPEYIISMMALITCGATVTATNPFSTIAEMTHQFVHSEPVAIFTSAFTADNIKVVAKKTKTIKKLFCYTPIKGMESYESLLRNEDGSALPAYLNIDPKEAIMFLPYSSGTTGLPKGVKLTHYNFIAVMSIFRVTARAITTDCAYSVLPLFHIYGLLWTIVHLLTGAKHVIDARFQVKRTFEMIQKHRVTVFTAVPPILLEMAKSPLLEKYDLSSLKQIASGAAPLGKEIPEIMMRKANIKVYNGWGLTEMGPIVISDVDRCPAESVGFVAPNTQIKVLDVDTGNELGPNEDGELCARGPQLMVGYYKNERATKKCIDCEGWFHTGDIGHVDENGIVFIVDRLKELIKYKGFQVAPAELEGLLISHQGIADAAVIGIPDKMAGELPRAYVVLKDKDLTVKQIHAFVNDHVSKYKQLSGGIELVEEIPKSPSGKILRKFLRKRYAEEMKAKL